MNLVVIRAKSEIRMAITRAIAEVVSHGVPEFQAIDIAEDIIQELYEEGTADAQD